MMDCRITVNKATSYPEIAIPDEDKNRRMDRASAIYDVVKEIKDQGIEYCILITTTVDKKIIAMRIVGIGSESSAALSQETILQMAVLDGAKGIILVHNHPSSGTSPSPTDIRTFRSMKEAAATIGIRLVDAVIVSSQNYESVIFQVMKDEEEEEEKKKPEESRIKKTARAIFEGLDYFGGTASQVGAITLSLSVLIIYYELSYEQPLPPLTFPMVTIIMLFPLGWALSMVGKVGKVIIGAEE